MCCGAAGPIYSGKRCVDWDLDDPEGKDVEVVRTIHDEISSRVETPVSDLRWALGSPGGLSCTSVTVPPAS
jgi:arsenate reductase (thioredoxin)